MARLATINLALSALWSADAFSHAASNGNYRPSSLRPMSWDENNNNAKDSNTWTSSNFGEEDWETKLTDGSYWSASATTSTQGDLRLSDKTDELLDILASQQATEVIFNDREAERADKMRQMEEWGFERSTIASALDVAVEEKIGEEMENLRSFMEDSYLDRDDPFTVESHAKVPRDPDTNEPSRSQSVYVDEHACIGCTNCAMIAQSTFFMEEENGRARVFEQWGDDDNTIQAAIETCPVDCIHYVPYEELAQLEVQRRGQYINVLAGLVSRAERGAGSGLMSSTPRSFGSKQFTDAPRVSRAYDKEEARAELEAKEKLRLFKDRRRRLDEERRRDNKVIDL